MMAKNKISGVICEFNPLHNGHAALLQHIRQETGGAVVCVMSGNFVQRGETAALDKWSRTRLALQNGADLVIELPLPWAMAGAEKFAYGGVSLLQALGCTDQLWFGSECGDANALLHIAGYLLSEQFSSDVKPHLAEGLPFAAARSRAIEQVLGADAAALNEQPNNILGIEYCKALLKLGSDIAPHTIPRFSVAHDASAANGQFASASLIRRLSAAFGRFGTKNNTPQAFRIWSGVFWGICLYVPRRHCAARRMSPRASKTGFRLQRGRFHPCRHFMMPSRPSGTATRASAASC